MNVTEESSKLVRAFIEDHKLLMRCLADIVDNLKSKDYAAAKETATELDRTIGSHIRFEEEVLYPGIAKTYSSQCVEDLREEHAVVRRALERLMKMAPRTTPDARHMREVESVLAKATDCGGSGGLLVSQLHRMSQGEQSNALSQLARFREEGVRWTELPHEKTRT